MTLIALVVGQSFTIMAVSMIAIGWLVMARRVRNMVFMFRDREYNLASRCLGTPLWRVSDQEHPALSGLPSSSCAWR